MASPANGTWYTLTLPGGGVLIFTDLHVLGVQVNSMVDALGPVFVTIEGFGQVQMTMPQILKILGGAFPPPL